MNLAYPRAMVFSSRWVRLTAKSYSNTSFLADQGWRGVYVEPIPRYFWRMKLRHAFNNVKGENVGIGDASGNSEIKVMGPRLR